MIYLLRIPDTNPSCRYLLNKIPKKKRNNGRVKRNELHNYVAVSEVNRNSINYIYKKRDNF